MTGTSRDMTGERNGGASPVYGLYGELDDQAESVEELLESGAVLRQVPVDVLIALETGAQTLRREALEHVAGLEKGDFIGAAGYDDWWNTALSSLNRDFPLADARKLIIDKAAMYARIRDQGLNVAPFMSGQLSAAFLSEAVQALGPRPIIKPTTGAGSRGVYRYRTDLSVEENLSLYRGILKRGNIDSSIGVIAAEYLDSPEVSVEVLIAAGGAVRAVVHEKRTATDVHPFVDLIMVSPPLDPQIRESEPSLQHAVSQLASALKISDGVLHAELRLHQRRWHVLDVGVRPGAGLVRSVGLCRILPRRSPAGEYQRRPAISPRRSAVARGIAARSAPAVPFRRWRGIAEAGIRAAPPWASLLKLLVRGSNAISAR